MIWKNKYKRKKIQRKLINFRFLNLKGKFNNYMSLILWIFIILIFYSLLDYNFSNLKDENDYRKWNAKQIKKMNLSELYKLKNLNHNDVRIWVLNNTNQKGLAAKIRECLEKGYYIGETHIKGDYNILKQDNFNSKWSNRLKTEIFVHVDTVNNLNFTKHLKEFLLFTGYNSNIVQYRYEYDKSLFEERDITIKLGEDWDKTGNLIQCNESIN